MYYSAQPSPGTKWLNIIKDDSKYFWDIVIVENSYCDTFYDFLSTSNYDQHHLDSERSTINTNWLWWCSKSYLTIKVKVTQFMKFYTQTVENNFR